MAKHPQRHVDRSRSVTQLSIGEYLIRRLGDYSLRHVFGVPGDYVLGFYSMLEHSSLELVNCTREDCDCRRLGGEEPGGGDLRGPGPG